MKRSDAWKNIPRPATACLMLAGFSLVAGGSHAVTAVGTASATVVDSVTVIITVPPTAPPPAPTVVVPAPASSPVTSPAVLVQTAPALAGTVFSVQRFTGSLSTSGPLLRSAAPVPAAAGTGGSAAQSAGAAEVGTQSATAGTGSVAAGATAPAANTATVNVTRKADGSLAVSGGSALTFAVSQPVNGVVSIEYN